VAGVTFIKRGKNLVVDKMCLSPGIEKQQSNNSCRGLNKNNPTTNNNNNNIKIKVNCMKTIGGSVVFVFIIWQGWRRWP